MIFDIHRASLHDGPGIRTTVFLKGCSLRCLWCHNPESQWIKPQLLLNRQKCVNCFACVSICDANVHTKIANVHHAKHSLCELCGKCVLECPAGALKIIGYESDVNSIMAEVEKDRPFYEQSGGGLTISGGEPMVQPDFTSDLLKEAHNRDIHTCLETSGFAPREDCEKILPHTDIFLFDYKATGSDTHKKLTGQSNKIILSNLDFIYNSGASIILRCPLVEGTNDTESHFHGIAALSQKYPKLEGIEIMAYHNMGISKAEDIGSTSPLDKQKFTDEKTIAEWLAKLKSLGCDNVIAG